MINKLKYSEKKSKWDLEQSHATNVDVLNNGSEIEKRSIKSS